MIVCTRFETLSITRSQKVKGSWIVQKFSDDSSWYYTEPGLEKAKCPDLQISLNCHFKSNIRYLLFCLKYLVNIMEAETSLSRWVTALFVSLIFLISSTYVDNASYAAEHFLK